MPTCVINAWQVFDMSPIMCCCPLDWEGILSFEFKLASHAIPRLAPFDASTAVWTPSFRGVNMTTVVTPPPPAPTTLQEDPPDATLTALSTLSLLNLRLSRLEFLLTGTTSSQDADLQPPSARGTTRSPQSISSQLHVLESRLAALKRLDGLPGSLVRMVDTLRREYPEIFSSSLNSPTSEGTSTKDLSLHADEVLSHATLYSSTSSRLQTLQTLRIPPAIHSANLIGQGPRVKLLLERQDRLEAETAELRERSARAIREWREIEVDGMNELWDDWQERIKVCERTVKREERRQRDENS